MNYPATKVAYLELSPLACTGWRFLLAATLIVGGAVRNGAAVPPPRGLRLPELLLAMSGVGVYQLFFAIGVARTSGFAAALMNSTSPLLALLLVGALGYERIPHATALATTFALGTPGLLAWCAPAMIRQDYARVSAGTWTILVLSAVFPPYVSFRLWARGLAVLGVAATTRIGVLVPVLAGVSSALWTGERFSWAKTASAAVVMGGLALARRGRVRAPAS